jgi:hypothetical protein
MQELCHPLKRNEEFGRMLGAAIVSGGAGCRGSHFTFFLLKEPVSFTSTPSRFELLETKPTKALFRLQKICNSDTVAFSFVFDKFYLIID